MNNCWTKGQSPVIMQQAKMDKTLQQHFQTPLRPEEKASSWHITPESTQAFFARQNRPVKEPQMSSMTTKEMIKDTTSDLPAQQFCSHVTEIINNSSFQKQHKRSRAPLAM